EVFAHGFFTIGGQRMSKSIGNVIAPRDLVERFGVDAARYLLVTDFPFGTDGDLNLEAFEGRYNAELANDLGNLLNRTVSMINRYYAGVIPAPTAEHALDVELRLLATDLPNTVDRALANLEFVAAGDAIRAVVSRANRYIEENAPWKLAKTDRDRLATVMYTLAETERLIAVVISPFMPVAAEKILDQLGTPGQVSHSWGTTGPGTTVVEVPTPLFPRIEAGVAVPN
ncbi:MAG TPA: class I tRNA ligase family protein, partial [Chloroflexota bacterium]|nr:class I tRNA ligase family protein [Chloroflexota bacterium]